MNDIAIRVERLGKRYRIGARQPQANTLFGRLKNLAVSPLDYLWSTLRGPSADEILWALKDVSFEVKKGEVVGIIGRNGAGKSTLLKILARITEPTEGFAEINGRVGSLLEVGTGFHPQLTGRENIYLNGAILGMRKADMDRQFDEIVAFAEIDKFIDTPVKRYSSGMYVRLAFAVAAHLEPDILLVDEVLAVGDVAFQKKCLGKMQDVSTGGRTVLFVSHNMAAIKHLCHSAVFLEQGQVNCQDDTEVVINKYLRSHSSINHFNFSYLSHNHDLNVTLKSIDMLGDNGKVINVMQSGSSIVFKISVETVERYNDVFASIGINSSLDDVRVCVFHSRIAGYQLTLKPPQTTILCAVPKVLLTPGRYRMSLKMMAGDKRLFYLPNLLEVDVVAGDFYGTGHLPDSWGGVCLIEHTWKSHADECVPGQRAVQNLEHKI